MRTKTIQTINISQFLPTFLAFVLFLVSATNTFPITSPATHCPTAKVQAIAQTVTQQDCCNKTTTKIIYAKPTPTDKDFVQCTCAEKDKQNRTGDSLRSNPELPVAIAHPLLQAPILLPRNNPEPIQLATNFQLLNPDRSPPVPPPNPF